MTDLAREIGALDGRLTAVEDTTKDIQGTVNVVNERLKKNENDMEHLHECIHDVANVVNGVAADKAAKEKLWDWTKNALLVLGVLAAVAAVGWDSILELFMMGDM